MLSHRLCRTFAAVFVLLRMCFVLSYADACGYPGSPAHSNVAFSNEVIGPGTVATYKCEGGFELLGPSRRVCAENGTWVPIGVPFCVLNVAAGKAPMQSSTVGKGFPQKAVDGSTSTFFNPETCSMTEAERAPWWYVNLLEPYMVQLVRIDFGTSCCSNNRPATITVRVGNNRPDLGINPICNKYAGFLEEGRPLFLPCATAMPGAFVSVHFESPPGNPLSICETFVYTDQALPIERCPSFRDQPLGGTATYNGKCYIFYNNQPTTFESSRRFCEIRGGSLVDETSPALQGFLSWELYRRHRNDPNGQYWMGAIRDPRDRNNWKWINGKDMTISFWNLPGTNENCSRFDGAKGWLWSDTNCNLNLNFICQHRPLTCGKPEQPANATIVARGSGIGSVIEYRCAGGHLLVGPNIRTCLPNGFFSEFPPKCRYLECGRPVRIAHGGYKLLNGTKHYLSLVRYHCDEGYVLVGRAQLVCDVDERWNGPPPRCEPVLCPSPPAVLNGRVLLSGNTTVFGTTAEYACNRGYALIGSPILRCSPSGFWDSDAPVCEAERTAATTTTMHPPPAYPSSTVPATRPHPTTFRPVYTQPPHPPVTEKPAIVRHPIIVQQPPATSAPTTTPSPLSPTHLIVVSTMTPSTTATASTTTATSTTEFIPARSSTRLPPRKKDGPNQQPAESINVPIVTMRPHHQGPRPGQENLNVRTISPPRADDKGGAKLGQRDASSTSARLNMGGIIALGVFGGFVFLAAIITIIVIIVRRTKNRRNSRGSVDNTTITTYDSAGSGDQGLHKYYKRAWENLRYDSKSSAFPANFESSTMHRPQEKRGSGVGGHAPVSRLDTLDNPNVRGNGRGTIEGFREANEIMVSDVAALYSRPEKRNKERPASRNSGIGGGHRSGKSIDVDERGWYDTKQQQRRSKY